MYIQDLSKYIMAADTCFKFVLINGIGQLIDVCLKEDVILF